MSVRFFFYRKLTYTFKFKVNPKTNERKILGGWRMKKLLAFVILAAICAMMIVPAYACYYTPGYWKNHPEDWPITEMNICGTDYDQAGLMDILQTSSKGDKSIDLAHHLIAAKLNWASGARMAYSGDLIPNAEAALCAAGGIGSRPSGEAKVNCVYYLDLLDTANNTPW